ncbi:PfkB family carbohydrate kinase [Microvirga makkahensis]|uniref:Sugar kinase n=1 Tax=Microvirga makkahensis TaxID=1128670 RepID=A0A7X3MUN8_9HYPH|nr:PfkB family carbohydrate kinase [Microvirga makkahensis]MXQ13393.1 sugar kinase [Microvirga makkahensis]
MRKPTDPARVLCVGVAVLDNMFAIDHFPAEPTKVFAQDFRQVGGGPAANAAVTIARLGGDVSLWARVGDDGIGAGVIAELAQYNVDTSTIRRVPGRRTGVSAVMVDDNGERFIIAFADRELDTDPSWLPSELPRNIDTVLCDVRWPAASEKVLRMALESGIPSVLDADLTNDDAVERLIGLASHAVFSAPALRRLAGTDDIEGGLRAAQSRTKGIVSVTLGADGFAWLEHGEVRRVRAFPIEAVDTLAAGDVFHGAFALALAEGHPTEGAGRFAGAAAALKCTRWGGRAGIPTREELDGFMTERA